MTTPIDDQHFITRPEYESRHANLETRIFKLESSSDALRRDFDSRFDRIMDKIDANGKELRLDITALKDDVNKSRQAGLQWAIGLVASFVTGGGLILMLQYLHIGLLK